MPLYKRDWLLPCAFRALAHLQPPAKDIAIPSMKIITSEGTGSPSKSARGANEAKAPEQVVCPLYHSTTLQ